MKSILHFFTDLAPLKVYAYVLLSLRCSLWYFIARIGFNRVRSSPSFHVFLLQGILMFLLTILKQFAYLTALFFLLLEAFNAIVKV